eukprot:CAMPEP_0115373358 /NCGR_PEP_ID=MMETSP0271-20121206/1391_1 /TAXON_ID=71861 /ORGANISM="Scrippsiella trochoidea, Strain CCMP3099" /LENGTH=2196 /DNA_ID=CAMNT_0002796359 /DNA_START=21 /DNA_END=6611 /DNA_ORIENTATION=+
MRAFLVEGAGRSEVNGVYGISLQQQCDGADVYRKAGTSFALLRHGEGCWSLADFRGGSSNRWTLRTVELYRCIQIPAGNTPPPLGWQVVDGEDPPPMIHVAKHSLFMKRQEEKASEGAVPTKKKPSRLQVLSKAASEPRLPRIRPPAHIAHAVILPQLSDQARVTQDKAPYKKMVCSFRVVLSRPSARVPWGVVWSDEAFKQSGSRIVGAMKDGSPVTRWNTWQKVRGRSGCCVQAGDQLVRVDGLWAYYDAEVGINDANEAMLAIDKGESSEAGRSIVLEFLRPVLRPPIPAAPQLEAWDSMGHLVINFRLAASRIPYKILGWALCIVDLDRGLWFVVDGASRAAIFLGVAGSDCGALDPEITKLHVSHGLASNRTYAVCVSCLSPRGWSAFSELSRPKHLSHALSSLDENTRTVPLEDPWQERPRFAVPAELVPGASSPVQLRFGARDFLGSLRRIRIRTVVQGCTRGLHKETDLCSIGDGVALLVERIAEDSMLAKWNEEKKEQYAFTVHGAEVAPYLRAGDLIIRINGTSGAAGMLKELKRCPDTLAIVLERRSGGGGSNESDLSQQDQLEDSLFPIDNRLDVDAVQAAETIQWYTLLSPNEAILAARLVESEPQGLEVALQAVLATTGDEHSPLRHPSILQDAERRSHVFRRCGPALEDGSGSRPASRGGVQDDTVLLGMRKAMGDIAADPEQLLVAIKLFSQASHAVRTSQVGGKLLARAQNLEALWRWQQDCASTRADMLESVEAILRHEAELCASRQQQTTSEDPPHDLEPLLKLLERATSFGDEMEFERAEAGEVVNRLNLENDRFLARREIDLAAKDPRENEDALTAALDAGEAIGLEEHVIEAGRQLVRDWRIQHAKNAQHDELFTSVAELRLHVANRGEIGAGADEQRRVRRAIAGSGLPKDDPLVKDAVALLKRWEGDNLALRSEARLQNAVRRAEKGYSPDEQSAGDLLGSAIAEVSQQGVDAQQLDNARNALAFWQASRLRRARIDLATAMEYRDQDFLKDAVGVARAAGVEKTLLEDAVRFLRKLQMEDEINKLLEGVMEARALDSLEAAVQRAHHFDFLEDENPMLRAGSLMAHMRFWTTEFQKVAETRDSTGLQFDVDKANVVLRKVEDVLPTLHATGVPEVAFRTCERDMKSLRLLMPKIRDLAEVRVAEDALNRVLGAVERYAADLPEVIMKGDKAAPKGLDKDLVRQAKEHLKAYDSTVKDLTKLVEAEVVAGAEIKSALIKARLAGAPEELIKRASDRMDNEFPDLWQCTRVEIELLVALREADDIAELNAAGRFMRVQNAADEAKGMRGLELSNDVLAEVDEISLALAAERTLAVEITQAEGMLDGTFEADADKLNEIVDKLKRACTGCDASAQEEAKNTLLPKAEVLVEKLEQEANSRADLLRHVRNAVQARGTTKSELRAVLIAARQGFVPESLLLDAYAKLRKKKIEFLPGNLKNALAQGQNAVAVGLWQRGLALKIAEERNGADWKDGVFEKLSNNRRLDDLAIMKMGEFSGERSGGAFGTATWRQNPYYIVRKRPMGKGLASPMRATKVTVVVAEGGQYPATLSVHAVRNNEHAAAAGCGSVLVPGFEVLGSSQLEDEIPTCAFQLPEPDPERPVFVVPSAAHGEHGPFVLAFEASDEIEVEEVSDAPRTLWQCEKTVDLQWKQERPFFVQMGGGRTGQSAPRMSWYRNPQFHVKLPWRKQAPKDDGVKPSPDKPSQPSSPQASASPRAAGVASPVAAAAAASSSFVPSSETALALCEGQRAAPQDSGPELTEKELAQLGRIFGSCDAKGDGSIDKRELIKAVMRDADTAKFFGLPRKIRQEDGSRDKMEERFQAMDADGDREVSWEEFVTFYKLHIKPKPPEMDPEVLTQLGTIFGECDCQGNGSIDKKELIRACLRNPDTARFFGLPMQVKKGDGSRELIERKFQAMDKDGDREVTWDEFVAFFQTSCFDNTQADGAAATSKVGLEQQARLGRIFSMCDSGSDGVITKRELIKACRKHSQVSRFFGLAPKIAVEDGSRDHMEDLFGKLDADGDRNISWDEFLMFYEANCAEIPIPEEEEDMPIVVAKKTSAPPPAREIPLLFARLVPVADGNVQAPAAVHIIRNRPGAALPGECIVQNPGHHDIVSHSGLPGKEYAMASEAGAVCTLSPDPEGAVVVIPSLETQTSEARYTLHLLCTEEIIVKRIG